MMFQSNYSAGKDSKTGQLQDLKINCGYREGEARRGAFKIYFRFYSQKIFSDYNELILDEHEECGCQCSPYAK